MFPCVLFGFFKFLNRNFIYSLNSLFYFDYSSVFSGKSLIFTFDFCPLSPIALLFVILFCPLPLFSKRTSHIYLSSPTLMGFTVGSAFPTLTHVDFNYAAFSLIFFNILLLITLHYLFIWESSSLISFYTYFREICSHTSY